MLCMVKYTHTHARPYTVIGMCLLTASVVAAVLTQNEQGRTSFITSRQRKQQNLSRIKRAMRLTQELRDETGDNCIRMVRYVRVCLRGGLLCARERVSVSERERVCVSACLCVTLCLLIHYITVHYITYIHVSIYIPSTYILYCILCITLHIMHAICTCTHAHTRQ